MNKNILILAGLFGGAFFGFYLYKKMTKPKPILDSSLSPQLLPSNDVTNPINIPIAYVWGGLWTIKLQFYLMFLLMKMVIK